MNEELRAELLRRLAADQEARHALDAAAMAAADGENLPWPYPACQATIEAWPPDLGETRTAACPGCGHQSLVAGEDAQFPVVTEAGDGEVLRPGQRLLAGPAGVGDDGLGVDAAAFVGDHTRSAPSGGVMAWPAKSALKVAMMAATSARLVSTAAKSRAPA